MNEEFHSIGLLIVTFLMRLGHGFIVAALVVSLMMKEITFSELFMSPKAWGLVVGLYIIIEIINIINKKD